MTGSTWDDLSISYLGLPLISGKLRTQDCQHLIMKLCQKLNSWANCFLSYAGRLQLIKAVLFGIYGYWSSHLFLSKGIIKTIKSLFATFLWNGVAPSSCTYNVAWSVVCLPKFKGGIRLLNYFKSGVLFNQIPLSSGFFG